MYHIFFIHSLVVGHLGWFHSLVIVNHAAINIGVQVNLLYVDLHSWTYTQEWYSRVVGGSIFSFLTILHTEFHSGCTSLHSHQQYMRVPFPHILASICCLFFDIAMAEMRWNLSAVLIYISFMAKDIKHFFMYLLNIILLLWTIWIILIFELFVYSEY
jgi:hypothetical protein